MKHRRVGQSKPVTRHNRLPSIRPSTFVIAAFLLKLAKHMALLACLLIIGIATGRTTTGPLGAFFLIVSAAVIYSVGRCLEIRSAALTLSVRVRR